MKKSISIFLIIILHLTFCARGASASGGVICNLSLADDYLLAPGDQLEIRIIGQKDLDTKQPIAPDGTISLPLVGRLTVAGMTLSELDKKCLLSFPSISKNLRSWSIILKNRRFFESGGSLR